VYCDSLRYGYRASGMTATLVNSAPLTCLSPGCSFSVVMTGVPGMWIYNGGILIFESSGIDNASVIMSTVGDTVFFSVLFVPSKVNEDFLVRIHSCIERKIDMCLRYFGAHCKAASILNSCFVLFVGVVALIPVVKSLSCA